MPWRVLDLLGLDQVGGEGGKMSLLGFFYFCYLHLYKDDDVLKDLSSYSPAPCPLAAHLPFDPRPTSPCTRHLHHPCESPITDVYIDHGGPDH